MPTVEIKNTAGEKVGTIDLDDAVFGADVNEHLLWEAVKWQRAKRRSGTASTRTVADVKGSGKKPYRQKGTGAARRGSERSHQFVGGGRAFGPHPRSYDYTLPKKVRKGALRSALSLRLSEKQLVVLDAFALEAKDQRPRYSQQVVKTLAKLGAKSALIVDTKENISLARGTRNLTRAKWIAPEGINVYDVLRYDTLLITAPSAKTVEETLKP
jgi:large subunit ribosomal protein L4